ncbi:MAG TPA: hypothetical protein VFA59_00875 [Vicinamibacterales bacterium]|nr:hypothetical protein [Vicinamibacterales bacterium]
MPNNKISVVIIAILFSSVSAQSSRAQQDKPIKHRAVHFEGLVIPEDLKQLSAASDAICVVRINNQAQADVFDPVYVVGTKYGFTVEEIIKSDSRLLQIGAMSDVYRMGGDRDKGDHIDSVDERDFPRFVIGREYILFLRWMTRQSEYWIAGGSVGAFEVDDARVVPLSKFTWVQSLRGMPISKLIATVKSNQ